MYSFHSTILDKLHSHEIGNALALIHETRGKQALYRKQKSEVLKNLQKIAIVESTESSSRLEGLTVSQTVLDRIIAADQQPAEGNRTEGEIAGYCAVLKQIHEQHADIPFAPKFALQFHRDLMQYAPDSSSGRWKQTSNEITSVMPDGTRVVRARTTEPQLVEQQIDQLYQRYATYCNEEHINPIILIALFVLDFLCIHPFADGNGRMARLLTLLMLYHQGYEMVRYISLERIIEQSKERYYDTLKRSDRGWHEQGQHAPRPWVEYFLSVLVKACNEFSNKVESVSTAYGIKKGLVIQAIEQMYGPFTISELGRKCPSVGRDTIRGTLMGLKKEGCLEVLNRGRYAKWRRTDKPLPV